MLDIVPTRPEPGSRIRPRRPHPAPPRRPPFTAGAAALWLAGALALWLAGTGSGCATRGGAGPEVDVARARPDSAAVEARRALARNPNDGSAHLELAVALAEEGKADEAVVHFEKAGALKPGLAGRALEERKHYAQAYEEDARAALDRDDESAAGTWLAAALAMVPGDPGAAFLQAQLAEKSGRTDEAIPAYRRAYQADRGNEEKREALVNALKKRAQARYEAGRYDEAWADLSEAASVDRSAETEYLMGTVAYAWAQNTTGSDREQHLDQAAAAFEEVLRRNSQDEDARFNLGTVYLAAQRYADAARVYRDLLSDNPTDGDLYLALARVHGFMSLPDTAQTEEAVGRALRAGQPVKDPMDWARRSADRFPDTDLASVYYVDLAPDAVYTYTLPGGGLVEVWLYWSKGLAEAFRDGARLGTEISIPRR